MAKGEKQKRLSLTTIERAGLLYLAVNESDKGKYILDFILFLESINCYGLPAIRDGIKEELLARKDLWKNAVYVVVMLKRLKMVTTVLVVRRKHFIN